MYFASSLVTLCLVVCASAYPLEVIQNEDGEAFALVPLSRVRRSEVYGNADITDPGRAIFGVKSTPIDTENHRLDTDIYATTNIRHHSPITKGIDASYRHLPTDSNLDLSVVNTPQWGTDLKASGKYNFFQDKNSNANVEGYYSRHYDGLPGTSRPDYGVMLNYRTDF